jgi:hypothetical protein
MYPHRIRLRGPWDFEPLARMIRQPDGHVETVADKLPSSGRMTLPCRWSEGGLPDFAGRVRFRRRFGLPRRLDPHEWVWLTFAGVEGVADIMLNGTSLGQQEGATGPLEYEVTELLRDRNELIVDVLAPEGNGGLWGEVALEVRCSAFLQHVGFSADFDGEAVTLHAAGEVAGSWDCPLELYLILDRSTVAYATVEASATSRVFQLASEPLLPERWRSGRPMTVRIELVQGATVWYSVEQGIAFQG